MESICRLVRVLQCPHECGHALIVALGSPGLSTTLAKLAAHLCDYSVFRINPSSHVSPQVYSVETFKADLVTAYTRAGVKVKTVTFKHIFFLSIINKMLVCVFFSVEKHWYNRNLNTK